MIILQFSYLPGTPFALYVFENESFVSLIGGKFFADSLKCRNLHFEHSQPLYTSRSMDGEAGDERPVRHSAPIKSRCVSP